MKHALRAVSSTFTHTRTRLILEKVWLEFESSGINLSVSGVQVWYSKHSLDHHSLECYWSGSWLRCGTSFEIAIIMSKQNYFSQLEKDILRIVISSFRGCLWVSDKG